MSVTVRDCLKLPSLHMASVIAGEKGLDGIVNSVTVLEFDLTADDLFTPNELAITAFYQIRDSISEQVETIKALKRSGIVALVLFYSDSVLHGIDPKVRETADRCNLPLIVMPGKDTGLQYSDVIRDINEAIFSDARSEDFYVNNTLDRISQMEERHRTLDNVLGLISEYNRSGIILCGREDKILGYALWPPGNTDSLLRTLHSPASEAMLSYDFKSKSGTALRLYFIEPFTSVSRNILAETAQIIQLYVSIWNVNLNVHSRESIIPFILEGKQDAIREVADINGLNSAEYRSMLVFKSSSGAEAVRNMLASYDPAGIADMYEHQIILFTTLTPDSTKGKLLFDEAESLCSDKLYIFTEERLIAQVPQFYLSYCENAAIVEAIFPHQKIISADLLRFADRCRLLHHAETAEAEYYRSLLYPIEALADSELLSTLQTYLLDAGSVTQNTAERLFIHRNTVKYRLDRIRTALGRDFEKMPFAYDVYLAAALKRLSSPYID